MRALGTTVVLGLVLTMGAGRAAADSQCMQDAKTQRGECRTQCDQDFVVARDLCRNIDPECAAACRVTLEQCRAPIVAVLQACLETCATQQNSDRAACPPRGRSRGFCMDHAQVRSFLCADDCREDPQVHDGLAACRDAFRTCMDGCGIPQPTATAVGPTPVKTDGPKPTEVEPTPKETDVPEPTPRPTDHPLEPTRTATPHPEPTQTNIVPR
jgi:hypothetical protein